ncbi:MAG: ArnT family glycosyltransferase, partial [Pseudomonadales bacterium]
MTPGTRPPPLYGLWAFGAVTKIAIFVLAGRGYGYLSDELYFLDAASHLAFGYVDFPPAIAWIGAAIVALLGSDVLVLRGTACLVGIGVTILAIDITRLLGGRHTAQWATALVVLFAPAFLSVQSIFTMNVFDQLWWALSFWLLIRYLDNPLPKYMIALGVIFGCAMLTKLSIIAWFAALGVSVLIYARWTLARTEVWAAVGLMLVISSPFLVWQVANGWPFLEFIQAYPTGATTAEAMVIDQPIFGLIATMNPPFMLIWLPGLLYGLVAANPTARILGTAAAICLGLFLIAGVKFYFATPLFILFGALGGLLWERWLLDRTRMREAFLVTMAISGLVSIPIAAPVLPPPALQRVADFIRDGEQGFPGTEPAAIGRYFPHFAEMHGWPGLVALVATHYQSIPAAERQSVTIVAAHFSQAGALNQLDYDNVLPGVY